VDRAVLANLRFFEQYNLGSKDRSRTATYLKMLLKANQNISLVSRNMTVDALMLNHFFDSLLPVTHLPPTITRIADLGSGAGFPAIPLALALPQVKFVVFENNPHKAKFLQDVISTLRLPNVTLSDKRLRDITARGGITAPSASKGTSKGKGRRRRRAADGTDSLGDSEAASNDASDVNSSSSACAVDLITTRAFGPFITTLERTMPYFNQGGQYLLYQAQAATIAAELQAAHLYLSPAHRAHVLDLIESGEFDVSADPSLDARARNTLEKKLKLGKAGADLSISKLMSGRARRGGKWASLDPSEDNSVPDPKGKDAKETLSARSRRLVPVPLHWIKTPIAFPAALPSWLEYSIHRLQPVDPRVNDRHAVFVRKSVGALHGFTSKEANEPSSSPSEEDVSNDEGQVPEPQTASSGKQSMTPS